MNPSETPVPQKGFFVTHYLTVKNQTKSKEFYVGILGGKIVKEENPCYIKLENSWIVLNSGGGPTPDKPDVLLAPPHDLNDVSSFLNLRVADIHDVMKIDPRKALSSSPGPSIIMAASCAATCVTRTVTSLRSANTRRPPLTLSRNLQASFPR